MATLMMLAAGSGHGHAREQPDTLTLNGGVRHTWDSNYNRRPVEDEEQITIAGAGLQLNHDIRRQHFSGSVGVRRYQHDQREFLDATTYRSGLGWRGALGRIFRARLSWSRHDRLVDRAEFEGRDIITVDTRQAGVVYVPGTRWEFPLTLDRTTQRHSNDSQELLDYDDYSVAAGVRYRSGRNSTVTLRLLRGEREHPHQDQSDPVGVPPGDDLDFDYSRAELETDWAVTGKTRLVGTLGYFDRDGERNDGSGGQVGMESQWQATSKIEVVSGYRFRQPAVGETVSNPSEVQQLYLDLQWQATPRLRLGTDLRYFRSEFPESPNVAARDETTHHWSPLTLEYQWTEYVGFRLNSAWQERDSPLAERNYTTMIATVGINLQF